MAGNTGNTLEAASVGGYELAMGSKPRELLFSCNGHIPGSLSDEGAAATETHHAFISGSGAFATSLAGVANKTIGANAANETLTVGNAGSNITVNGETLTYVAPQCFATNAGSPAAVTKVDLDVAGQIPVGVGATISLPTFTGTGGAFEAMPLVRSVNFGAGSLVLGKVSAQSVSGMFVFGSGSDSVDNLNIIDASIQCAVDLEGDNAVTNAGDVVTAFTEGDSLGNTDTIGTGAAICAVTSTSGGTVKFVITGTDDFAIEKGSAYRLSIRALAHPKGGI